MPRQEKDQMGECKLLEGGDGLELPYAALMAVKRKARSDNVRAITRKKEVQTLPQYYAITQDMLYTALEHNIFQQ